MTAPPTVAVERTASFDASWIVIVQGMDASGWPLASVPAQSRVASRVAENAQVETAIKMSARNALFMIALLCQRNDPPDMVTLLKVGGAGAGVESGMPSQTSMSSIIGKLPLALPIIPLWKVIRSNITVAD